MSFDTCPYGYGSKQDTANIGLLSSTEQNMNAVPWALRRTMTKSLGAKPWPDCFRKLFVEAAIFAED